MTPVAMAVGTGCALLLWGLSALAGVLQRLVWDDASAALGIAADSAVWIVTVLTITGLAVGLVIRFVPGHAGPDSATVELVSEPLPAAAVPGLALALVLMLAGGVSLGPENPILAVNAALAVAIGGRLLTRVPVPQWIGMTTAGTIGAMFGTPVAAALMLSEINAGDPRIPLWDRLFAPLVAAGTGSYVILQFTDLDMAISLPAEDIGGPTHVAIAVLIALVAGAAGVAAAYVLDPLHRILHRITNPVALLTAAGLVLGLLGALGGPITLFKGLDEMKDLSSYAATTTALGFLGLAAVKLVAMLVASAAGFRGGRIFPMVFVGAALGYCAHAFWPQLPVTLTVAAAITGIVVAATRNGWLSLFLALAVVPDMQLLTPLLFATLAAWLLASNRPELRARGPAEAPNGRTQP
ncbi:ion channel protein [Actinoplanes sp. NBC_00393]|uniref:ion channel protein n=1 Tax=Actinoplanes sp. NBC_00393 TaxID=2975953 RepID=UPI002E2304A3